VKGLDKKATNLNDVLNEFKMKLIL
jgi:hypothetical protein